MLDGGAYPYLDADGRTDAERYLTDIHDGKIITSVNMRKLADMLLPRFHDPYHDFHFSVEKALRPVQFIENFTCFPEGDKQGQPFLLEPFQRSALEVGFGFVDDDGYRQFRQVIMMIARKNGKAITISTQLPTPKGWRTMGEIHPGDYVFGQDGKPSRVIAESEIFFKETYRVTFEDGAIVDTSGDHIWTVQTKKGRECAKNYLPGKTNQISRRKYREGGWFETTTQEMFDDPFFVTKRKDGKGVEYKYRIPMNKPVEYPEKCLPIDPYTFGYWIGDGHASGPELTVGLEDLDEASKILKSKGHTLTIKHSHDNAYKMRLDGLGNGHLNPFKTALRDMSVLNNKHIPDMYLQGSVEQRRELLCGLMDTDGYVSKAGQCQFVQKSEAIVDQFVELCSSLGIKANKSSKIARCNGKPAGKVYQVEFWTDKDHSCFHLSRKHNRLKDKLAPRMSSKSIVKIERIPNEPTKCIAIDNPSHLYLVGHQYTATHNSALLAALMLYFLTSDNEPAAEVLCIANSERQSKRVFGHADLMRRKSPALKNRIRKGVSSKTGTTALNYDKNGSVLVSIASNVGTVDGYSASAYVYDELAATTDMGAVLMGIEESIASRRQASGWIISSENYVRHNIWDMKIDHCKGILDGKVEDDRTLPILYSLDDGDPFDNPSVWQKANPGLTGATGLRNYDGIKSISYMEDRCASAKQQPQVKSSFMTKDLCLRATSYTSYLTHDECHNPETFEVNPTTDRYGCVGFDLSSVGDLTACCCVFMRPGDNRIYQITHAWIPESQVEINSARDLKERDGVPYHLWASGDHPWVTIVQGDKIDTHQAILGFIDELTSMGIYTRYVGFDPWHVDDYMLRELKMRVGDDNCIKVPQNARTLSPVMKEYKIDLAAHRVINPSPVSEFCRSNVQAMMDGAGNVYPNKKELRPQNKIDVYMAELFAMKMLIDHKDEYTSLIGWYPPEDNHGKTKA